MPCMLFDIVRVKLLYFSEFLLRLVFAIMSNLPLDQKGRFITQFFLLIFRNSTFFAGFKWCCVDWIRMKSWLFSRSGGASWTSYPDRLLARTDIFFGDPRLSDQCSYTCSGPTKTAGNDTLVHQRFPATVKVFLMSVVESVVVNLCDSWQINLCVSVSI